MKKLLSLLVITAIVLTGCSGADNSSHLPSPTATPTQVDEPEVVIESEVVLVMPDKTGAVSSPMLVEGFAPGTWFFEANIVGEVLSESGEVLTTFPLQAQGEWMTEESVRFAGEAEFTPPEGDETIQLVIKNDNPSGLPENEKSQSFTLLLEK